MQSFHDLSGGVSSGTSLSWLMIGRVVELNRQSFLTPGDQAIWIVSLT